MVDFDALNLVAMLLDDPDADVRSEVFGFCAELGDYHDPTLHSDEDTELPFLTLRAFLAQRAVLAAVARRLSGRRESVDAQVALVRVLHPVILYGDNVLSALVAVDMFSVLAHLIPVHDFLFHTFVSTPFDCAVDIFRGIFERGDPALLRVRFFFFFFGGGGNSLDFGVGLGGWGPMLRLLNARRPPSLLNSNK